MVHSYDDPLKQQTREFVSKLLRRHVLRQTSNTTVRGLAFLGAENSDEVGLEYQLLYQPLGIAKDQVLSVEQELEKAQLQAQHGFFVYHGTDRELLEHWPEVEILSAHGTIPLPERFRSRLDWAFFDYTSPYMDPQQDSLAYLIGKELLKPTAVLATNYAMKRLSRQFQATLWIRHLYTLQENDHDQPLPGASLQHTLASGMSKQSKRREAALLNQLEQMLVHNRDYELDDLRNTIAPMLRSHLRLGRWALAHHADDYLSLVPRCVAFLPEYQDFLRAQISFWERKRACPYGQKILTLVRSHPNIFRHNLRWLDNALPNPDIFLTNAELALATHFTNHRDFLNALDEKHMLRYDFYAQLLASMLIDNEIRPSRVVQSFSASYNSRRNEMMYFDALALQQVDAAELLGKLVMISKEGLIPNSDHLSPKRYGDLLEDLVEMFNVRYHTTPLPARMYLGSSWIPPKRALSRQDISRMRANGWTVDELAERYPLDVSKSSLASFRAHDTMRKRRGPKT